MRVRDVMSKDPVTVDEEASLRAAVRRMLDHDVGSVVVTREGASKTFKVGILTKTDVLAAVDRSDAPPSALQVGDEMSSPLVTVPPTERVEDAVETMEEKGVKHLVVTDRMRLVGVVTPTDVAGHHAEAMDAARRITSRRPDWDDR